MVGMVAVVGAQGVQDVLDALRGAGVWAWVLGDVHEAGIGARDARLVSGTKGVHGGTVAVTGTYRRA